MTATSTPASTHFLVRRDNLRECRWLRDDETIPVTPAPGQALLRTGRFAFTANNITYAVFGEAMAYWAFFPAPAGWGRIPVWGYAVVERSLHPDLPEGERVFGYLPMSSHLLVQPEKVGIVRFVDAIAHRQKLPAAYQGYTRLSGDSYYQPELEDHQSIFRPLFVTSFLIEDFLADHQLFGAKQVVLSSASSKTAMGLAHLLSQRRLNDCRVIGLTSASNRAFCESTGYYDQVLTYDALAELPAGTPGVFVDMAGNGRLLHDVHHHFGEQLKYSCMVGGTHWEQRQTQHGLPGAKPAFFFAPTQLQKRVAEWSYAGLESRLAEALQGFLATTRPWLRIVAGRGRADTERVYRQVLEGQAAPAEGHVLSIQGESP
jgi:hypothetical protein